MKPVIQNLSTSVIHLLWQGLLCAGVGLSCAHAQVSGGQASGGPLQTSATEGAPTAQVSIRKVDPIDEMLINSVSLQRFRAFGLPVRFLIVAAYCPRLTQRDFVDAMMTMRIDDKALGDDNSSFNVEATGISWQTELRKALTEQLGIKVVRTTKPTSVYALRVGPGGAHGLLEPGENIPDPALAPNIQEKQFDPEKFKDLPPALKEKLKNKPKSTGSQPWTKLDEAKGELDASRSSMPSLAMNLETVLQRPVLDETGLAGDYDVRLRWGNKGPQELLRLLHDQLGLDVLERNQALEWLVVERLMAGI